MKTKLFFVQISAVIIFIINVAPIQAQVSEDLYSYVNQIPVPPQSCKEAMDFVIYNSENNEIKLTAQIDTLEKFFDKIYNELSLKSESIKQNLKKRNDGEERGPGNSIPPNGFPEGMNGQSDMKNIMSDFHKSDKAMVKIDEEEEKFRSEMQTEQNSVNAVLKKTLINDIEGRVKIVDDFLKSVNETYSKFTFQLQQDFKELDEISKKYDYGTDGKKFMLKKKIIDLQLLEVKNLRLLLSCTKGSIMIGSEFYTKKK